MNPFLSLIFFGRTNMLPISADTSHREPIFFFLIALLSAFLSFFEVSSYSYSYILNQGLLIFNMHSALNVQGHFKVSYYSQHIVPIDFSVISLPLLLLILNTESIMCC